MLAQYGWVKATTGGPKRYPDMSIEILNYLQHVHISIVKVYIRFHKLKCSGKEIIKATTQGPRHNILPPVVALSSISAVGLWWIWIDSHCRSCHLCVLLLSLLSHLFYWEQCREFKVISHHIFCNLKGFKICWLNMCVSRPPEWDPNRIWKLKCPFCGLLDDSFRLFAMIWWEKFKGKCQKRRKRFSLKY